jgi:hypothetical protein
MHTARTACVALAFLVCRLSVAGAQTVIVPETTYSAPPTSLTENSTAMLDNDSVLMIFTEHSTFLGGARFQVVNINSGAVELSPVPLPDGMRVASVAVLAPDQGLLVIRDDNDGAKGKYFVVNPLTGAIVRGPIPFTSHGTGWEYRISVIDPSTVLIAHRSDDAFNGTFVVVDPQTATVKVSERTFVSGETNVMEVAALDDHHVAIAYCTPGPELRMSFTVVDPQDGQVVRPPQELGFGCPLALLRRDLTQVVLAYVDYATSSGRFVTLDTVTGSRGSPATFVSGDFYTVGITMLGADSIVFGFAQDVGPGEYVVHDIDGRQIVPPMLFNPEGPTYFVSAASSACRVLFSYQDVPDGQKGKLQVVDFSDVCLPRPCSPDITSELDLATSPFIPFYVPWLQLQLVVVRNPAAQPVQGPLSLVFEDLHGAVVIGAKRTECGPDRSLPFVRLGAGADDVLSPGEIGGAFILFLKPGADPLSYRPRVLQGLPLR